MPTENITLYYRAGSSDKVYQAAVAEKDGGFVVNFAYGRRGSTLQAGTKKPAPVPYEAAKRVYDKLVREKTAKGYTPGLNGTPYTQTDNEQRSTGVLPQLLNPVDEAQAEKLLADPAYWMQEKKDGKRVIIQVGEKITGINRKGLTIALPESIAQSVGEIGEHCVLDGEAIGDCYYVFDLLEINGHDLRGQSYHDRYTKLIGLIDVSIGTVEVVEAHMSTVAKRDAFIQLKQANAEGVVFKRHDAAYTAGRPASGGPQLKFKFCATGTFIVAGLNAGKRSVGLEVLDESGQPHYVGNVTIPANLEIPKKDSLVECRYLYAFKEGCLYQPVYLGERDDVELAVCSVSQLKYELDVAP